LPAFFLGNIQESAVIADAGFNIKTPLLRDQNNGQSGKIRRMPYVMPQQRKE
jgi:hypothetical protein